jgi:hypothetical protein
MAMIFSLFLIFCQLDNNIMQVIIISAQALVLELADRRG